MASIYDDIDVRFSWNGDLVRGDQGDIKHTSDDALQSLLDQIHSVCASALLDWEVYPNRGATLDDFVGEPNTRTTGRRIRDRVRLSLISADLVSEEDLQVRVVPVHVHKVLIIIKIDAIPTVFNGLKPEETLQTAVVFDTLEQGVFFLDKTPQIRAS